MISNCKECSKPKGAEIQDFLSYTRGIEFESLKTPVEISNEKEILRSRVFLHVIFCIELMFLVSSMNFNPELEPGAASLLG